MPTLPLGELASRLGRSCEGDAATELSGVASLESAGPGDLVFVRSARYAKALSSSSAGAVIVPEGVDAGPRPAIRSPDPGLDFARAAALLCPAPSPEPGVHPSAVVDPDARVDPTAHVGALAVVGARSRVGAGSVLYPHSVVYPDAVLGAACTLHAGAVVREGSLLGDRVVLQPGAIVGGDGFGYALNEQGLFEKVPQLGRVVIEDDVEIGAGATVDRATLGETRIGRAVKIDNLVMIGHNCELGEGTVVVAQTGLAGSTRVGRRAFLMAQVGTSGHLNIGDGAFLGARAGVIRDVAPGARVFGYPAVEERAWHRVVAALTRLPELLRRVRALEKHLGLRRGGNEPGPS